MTAQSALRSGGATLLALVMLAQAQVCAAAFSDFDNDGRSDILWRNSATGENYLYPMNGTTILGTEGYLRTVADQAWQVAGIGDFDGDGRADVLWRNSTTGENYLYLMNGTAVSGEGYLRTVADLNWKVAGVGDFDGDGKSDILWRNHATGENYLYPMNGLTIKLTEGYLRTVASQDWKVAGVGDVDGDGKADVLWRNSSSGENYVYLMNGTAIAGEGYLRTVADQSWQVAGVGDFNGDGRADLLWRNAATGENYLYPMNGTAILGTEGYLRTVPDQGWKVQATGDYDGDGKADVLWRNSSSGENYLYFLDGTTIKPTEGYTRTVADQNWKIAGANTGSLLLAGFSEYLGSYPAATLVTYSESGQPVTVSARLGQVFVFLNSGVGQSMGTSLIQSNGGTVLAKVPVAGFYFVQVTAGAEGAFIDAMSASSLVALALPHVSAEYMSAVTIIDGCLGPHGVQVAGSAVAQGGTLDQCRDDDDGAGKPALDQTLIELYKEVDQNGTAGPTLINLSTSGGLNGADYTGKPVEEQLKAQKEWKAANRVMLAGIAALPEAFRENVLVTIAAGNGNMPLTSLLAELRADPRIAAVLSENVLLVGAPDSVFLLSNDAPGDPDFAMFDNATAPNGNMGTSYAAPRVMAIIQRVMVQKGLTVKQALQAAKTAVFTNANGLLVEDEMASKADAIKAASAGDPPGSASVASISFTAVGAATAAVISPAMAGVTVQYAVSGTDGYYQSESLPTNASGQVSFSIPPGAPGVTDTISVTAVLSGKTARTTYTW